MRILFQKILSSKRSTKCYFRGMPLPDTITSFIPAAQVASIHVNPERSFQETNSRLPSEVRWALEGGSGGSPPIHFQKPVLQMVQSELFLSCICE